MDELIDTVNPQKLLFIGFDGEEFYKLLGIEDM